MELDPVPLMVVANPGRSHTTHFPSGWSLLAPPPHWSQFDGAVQFELKQRKSHVYVAEVGFVKILPVVHVSSTRHSALAKVASNITDSRLDTITFMAVLLDQRSAGLTNRLEVVRPSP
jgi:hypothetical protein